MHVDNKKSNPQNHLRNSSPVECKLSEQDTLCQLISMPNDKLKACKKQTISPIGLVQVNIKAQPITK